MEDFVKRVVDEKNELDEKRVKLNNFFGTETYEKLEPEMKILMAQQAGFMRGYSEMLDKRLELLANIN